jgi:hypothetical protein
MIFSWTDFDARRPDRNQNQMDEADTFIAVVPRSTCNVPGHAATHATGGTAGQSLMSGTSLASFDQTVHA